MITGKRILSAAILLAVVAGGFWFYRARNVSAGQPCCNNLRQFEGAKEQWAIDNSATSGTEVAFGDILPYLKKMPHCNKNGTYSLGRIGEEPRCSVHGTASHFKQDRL